MKVPEQEIEAGLETQFWQMAQDTNNGATPVVVKKKGSPAKANFYKIASRSLFVKWENLWNSFSTSRKFGWIVRWVSLPFGGHYGAGGWPGSGYSAFVFENSYNYKNNLPLQLDWLIYPLAGTEILTNGSFTGSASGWFLQYGFSYSANMLRIIEVSSGQWGLINQNPLLIKPNGSYKLKFDIYLKKQENGLNPYCRIQLGDNANVYTTLDLNPYKEAGWQTIEIDLTANVENYIQTNWRLALRFKELNNYYSEYSYFDNFSLKENV